MSLQFLLSALVLSCSLGGRRAPVFIHFLFLFSYFLESRSNSALRASTTYLTLYLCSKYCYLAEVPPADSFLDVFMLVTKIVGLVFLKWPCILLCYCDSWCGETDPKNVFSFLDFENSRPCKLPSEACKLWGKLRSYPSQVHSKKETQGLGCIPGHFCFYG